MAGGSNGWRLRLWKLELQTLADDIGVPIAVCHFPPGTSKWNKIDHRLFSFISSNWRGEPLRDYETVVDCEDDDGQGPLGDLPTGSPQIPWDGR